MPPDPVRVADTRAWLAKAGTDLRAGAHELLATPPFCSDAVFHAQQAAEKAWKDPGLARRTVPQVARPR